VSNDAYINQLVGNNTISLNRAIQVNDVFLLQSGHLNTAVISQRQGSTGGNLALLRQQGAFEQIVLTQIGSNNQVNFQQYVRNNSINVTQRGNFISSTVLQSGQENSVLMELGSNNQNYNIIQHGNNWKVIDIGFSPDNPGYTIEQTGAVGMTITIEHN
jgi:hypothetical protein